MLMAGLYSPWFIISHYIIKHHIHQRTSHKEQAAGWHMEGNNASFLMAARSIQKRRSVKGVNSSSAVKFACDQYSTIGQSCFTSCSEWRTCMLNGVLQLVRWWCSERNASRNHSQELNFHRRLFKYVGELYVHLRTRTCENTHGYVEFCISE